MGNRQTALHPTIIHDHIFDAQLIDSTSNAFGKPAVRVQQR